MTKHGLEGPSSTANRGVEANEMEIANTHLDRESCASSAPDGSSLTTTLDGTGSYVQVVVQKHRRARAAASCAAQTSPRLPAASSPIRQSAEGAGDGVLLLPASVLLACSPGNQQLRTLYQTLGECGRQQGEAGAEGAGDAAGGAHPSPDARAGHADHRAIANAVRALNTEQKIHKNSAWKIFNDIAVEKLDLSENAPERVEVYYFEHGSASYLATRAGARVTRAERVGRRVASVLGPLLAEPLAAAQLLLAVPIALIVGIERCVLTAVRDLVTGCVQTAADYAVKPALALSFNAGVWPALACAANVSRATREALMPLWATLGDALEPAARALAQLRLVHVRLDPRCRCRCQETERV